MLQNIELWLLIVCQFGTKGSSAADFKRGVVRELWQSLPGKYVSNFTSSQSYPNQPKFKETIKWFYADINIGINYGQRLSSFYRAPQTGLYTFFMTCQDECELWLSSSSKPDDTKRVLFIPYGLSLNHNQWDRYPVQKSSPINLIGGEFYFMQAIMKADENINDHLGVGVRQPDGQNYRPISNEYLFVEIPEKRSASFRLVHSGAALHGHVMDTFTTNSNTVCSLYCARDLNCKSYNYDKEEGNCELNDGLSAKNAQGLVPSENVDYYEKLDLYYPRL
ncbi:uncharacterized protein [Acropora muricata]|uniref:uncharacterized protein isoform X1 n=1 Tax=Acropora muricata TaxID=159855 RepID=UPI0034E37A78